MRPGRALGRLLLLLLAFHSVAEAATTVLVLRDGLRSEYGFCREDERGGWGARHPAVPLFRAGILDHAHRFQRYLPKATVRTVDVETLGVDLPLRGADLVVVDDVRAAAVTRFAQQVVDFAEGGGAVIVVGGFFGFGGSEPHARFSMTKQVSDYRTTHLARILPVDVTAAPDYITVRRPKIAFAGAPSLGEGLALGAWPLYGYHRTRPKVTAKVLATLDGHPLIALHAVGRGRVVAFTGSELETAFANPKADPWPHEAVFWQRLVAAALGRRDAQIPAPELAAPPAPDPTVSLAITNSVRRGTELKGEIAIAKDSAARRLLLGKDGVTLAAIELKPGKVPFRIATRGLRPGVYDLVVAAADGTPVAAKRLHVAAYDPHFQNLLWWGQGDFPDGSELRRRMIADLRAHRVGAGAPVDLCERHGIWAMQSLGGIGALSKFAEANKKPESQWMDASGKRRGRLCFNDPLFTEALPKWADSKAPELAKLHSLGLLHIEDEAGCPDCYCEDCLRLFKAKHGTDMPRPTQGMKLSRDALDRWVARMDFKLATFARYHKAVYGAFKQRLPHATILTSLPQGFTVAHGETVIDHQRHLDAFWEHTYPGTEPLGAALTAHRVDMAAAAIGAPERPVIHLLQGFDEISRVPKMPPPEYIRLISWMALSHGADHLGWFVYRWMWWHMPGTEAWDAAGEMAALLERLAPTLANLGPTRYPIALLYPLSQEMADHLRAQTTTDAELPQRGVWTWRVWHSYEDAYFSMKLAGLPVEPLYEESVRAGKLRYEAIVVPHADYLRPEVVAGLRKYLDAGGAVYLGASSTLDLPGAQTLPLDFLTLFNTYFPAGRKADWQKERVRHYWIRTVLDKAEHLRRILAFHAKNPVVVSEPQVVWNLREGGAVRYLFLVNDRTTNPITPAQRELRGRYAHFVIMPMRFHPAHVAVSLKSSGPVYDVLSGGRVAEPGRDGRVAFKAELEGGGARCYALLPERIRSLRVAARKAIEAGAPLPIHVGVWGSRKLLAGVVPLKITLQSGKQIRTRYAATRAGECQLELATDLELPAGPARLTVTETLSGVSASRDLELLPPKPALAPVQ